MKRNITRVNIGRIAYEIANKVRVFPGLPISNPVPCKNLIQSVLLQKPENPSLSIGGIGPSLYGAHSQMAWFILNHIFSTILSIINMTRLSNQEKDLEILILRQQLSILQRKHNSPIKPKPVVDLVIGGQCTNETLPVLMLRSYIVDLAVYLSQLFLLYKLER